MSYTIQGLVVSRQEQAICYSKNLPFVSLDLDLLLIPLDRHLVFLIEGDETEPAELTGEAVPPWLSELGAPFDRSAYIEAVFWGGAGRQASCVWTNRQLSEPPVISSGAINFALMKLGIPNTSVEHRFGIPVPSFRGKDPFDMVGLGRFRSTDAWIKAARAY